MVISCCGLLRSGSTLSYHIVSGILGNEFCLGYGWEKTNSDHFSSKNLFVIKDHNPCPDLNIEHAVKYVYTIRDIRDMAASYKQRLREKFDVHYFVYHVVYRHLIFRSKFNIFQIFYYDLVNKIEETIELISDFIGVSISSEKKRQIIENSNFDMIKQKCSKLCIVDGLDLWHPNHIADGRSNKWNEILTEDEISLIESIDSGLFFSPVSGNFTYSPILIPSSIDKDVLKRWDKEIELPINKIAKIKRNIIFVKRDSNET